MWKILCAIYTRLSKEDEDKHQPESESIQNQKSLLTAYAADHGWDIYSVYCDEDYSGADSLRPDFNRMLAAAKQRKFQILLFHTARFQKVQPDPLSLTHSLRRESHCPADRLSS